MKELGTHVLRYGLPNHLICLGPGRYDWSFADEALAEIRRLGIAPLLDLMHFGIPDWMGDFQNPEMPVLFAEYAGAVAQRYPWVRGYTPVNEIYVCARNSGWDGLWNERLRTERGFVTALKHLVAANLLANAAIARHVRQCAGGAGGDAFFRSPLKRLRQRLIKGRRHPHVKPTADEREAQRLLRPLCNLHAQAAGDAFTGLIYHRRMTAGAGERSAVHLILDDICVVVDRVLAERAGILFRALAMQAPARFRVGFLNRQTRGGRGMRAGV